jgi:hypothetical protein
VSSSSCAIQCAQFKGNKGETFTLNASKDFTNKASSDTIWLDKN